MNERTRPGAGMWVAAVGAAALVCLALPAPEYAAWGARDAVAFVGLATAIAVAELFPLPVRRGKDVASLTFTDALWMAGLLVLVAGPDSRPGVLTLAAATGSVAEQVAGLRPARAMVLRAGRLVVGVTASESVLLWVAGGSSSIRPATWAAAALAMACGFVAMAGLDALSGSGPARQAFARSLRTGPLLRAGAMALGVTGAVLWLEAPAAVPLLAAPVVLSYAATRAWLEGSRDRERMRTLYEAGLALSGPLDATSYGPFLGLVRRLFGAQTAELVVVEGEAVTIHDEGGAHTSMAMPPDQAGHPPQAYVPVRDGVSPQVAVAGEPGEVRAVLAVYRRAELSAADHTLLEGLCDQVRTRLLSHGRLAEVEGELARVSDVVAHSSDGIFVVSGTGVVRSWNPAMERITGSSAATAIGRTWADVFGVPPQEARGPDDVPEPAGEILLVGPDGDERLIRYQRTPVHDRDGVVESEVVVARDVTTEIESERLTAEFVATVSHELRTPLTPLKGFLATLIAGTGEHDPASRQEYYRIMANQTDRLERLITDLLEVSRIESGRVPVDATNVDLTGLVQEQIADFARQQPDRVIHLRAPGARVFVLADAFRVGQVVANLLSNALKYSGPASPVEVTVALAGSEQAIVSVRDEGEGIPQAEQERVFERFHRVAGQMTRRTGGTGLGLHIAKRLVEAMRGRLWVVSSPGNGSTFSFSLPAAPPDRQEPAVVIAPGHADPLPVDGSVAR